MEVYEVIRRCVDESEMGYREIYSKEELRMVFPFVEHLPDFNYLMMIVDTTIYIIQRILEKER